MYPACLCGLVRPLAPMGLREPGSQHCGVLNGAMTERSVLVQVLTYLPSSLCAPCLVRVSGEAGYAVAVAR
jgi:hypothetical protein